MFTLSTRLLVIAYLQNELSKNLKKTCYTYNIEAPTRLEFYILQDALFTTYKLKPHTPSLRRQSSANEIKQELFCEGDGRGRGVLILNKHKSQL